MLLVVQKYVLIKRYLFLIFCLYFIFSCRILFAQQEQSGCLSLQQILNLLEQNVKQKDIITQVEKYYVEFKLDWRNAVCLCRAGASDSLLQAIDKNYVSILQIKFREWYPYGGITIETLEKESFFIANGSLNAYPGYTTTSSFNIGKRGTLLVKIEGSSQSTFTNRGRMLKVIAGLNQAALKCTDENAVSEDPEFIYQGDGTYKYHIPESIVSKGVLHKLGFVFGPGNINNLKISAWFQ